LTLVTRAIEQENKIKSRKKGGGKKRGKRDRFFTTKSWESRLGSLLCTLRTLGPRRTSGCSVSRGAGPVFVFVVCWCFGCLLATGTKDERMSLTPLTRVKRKLTKRGLRKVRYWRPSSPEAATMKTPHQSKISPK